MVLKACGAKYHIEEDFLDQTDVDDVVVALVNMAMKVYSSIVLMIFPYLICYLASVQYALSMNFLVNVIIWCQFSMH